ncbi:thioesterase II family protein [Pseudomonas sp. F01002]|uniref:thioesterase II family protein n=1 Tax=Pseudomonas sp. F01002 TaxID=2555724 RepID=UPI00106D8B7A|nr:alpha/beta fold hydrolase [Pseudomonas sp. F01002]TFB37822.1 thioesterase [Pseudomonas sp. F01002]
MHTQNISLICFPHAGGSNATYNGWGSRLSETIRKIKLGCFDGPAQRATFTDVDSLSAHIAEQLSHESQPLALYGHSMGAVLAYEVARKLSNRNTVQVMHLFVSGRRAPQLAARLAPIHHLSDQAFLNELMAYGGVPDAIGTNTRLLNTLIPIIRSDLALVETYQFHPMHTLKCPISAIYATHDPVVETDELMAWQERTTGDFSFHELSGNHFFHSSRPQALIDIIHHSLSAQSTRRVECKNFV